MLLLHWVLASAQLLSSAHGEAISAQSSGTFRAEADFWRAYAQQRCFIRRFPVSPRAQEAVPRDGEVGWGAARTVAREIMASLVVDPDTPPSGYNLVDDLFMTHMFGVRDVVESSFAVRLREAMESGAGTRATPYTGGREADRR